VTDKELPDYEKAKDQAERDVQAGAERRETIEREFYAALEYEYFEAPALITAAHEKFIEVALTGDLQATYTAWQAWQRVWSEQAAWTNLVHIKIWGRSGHGQCGDGFRVTRQPIIAQRVGVGDFSEDLKNALRGVLKNEAAAAYIKERTALLRAALDK